MARPKGTKYIESPEKLLSLFKEYEKYAKENPFKVKDWVGGIAKQVVKERERPLSIEGFEDFLFEKGVINDLGDYFSNKDGRYSDYSTICHALRRKCRKDQIDGGMAGIYNPSITQRLNGLAEQTENKHEISEIKITRK
jgi:hypothetical protein